MVLTTDVTMRASTITITKSAIKIPLQFRVFGFADTNCMYYDDNAMS